MERVLGLPAAITVCLLDLDGVLTDTASVHSAAWKQTFDEFLQHGDGDGFRPLPQQDSLAGVDPAAAVVFQDAVAGVQAAGHAGHFGYLVGVNRFGGQHAADLRNHGATVVVDGLARLLGES